jgi:PHP family Zn ribbon phosphoesterase
VISVRIDLHNHSCLSPCADDWLLPSLLALEAMEKGIQILGLTDHNATQNLPAFEEACALCSIMGVYGIEVTTIEEVHLLVLFERREEAVRFGTYIQGTLPKWPNVPSSLGRQLIVDVQGTIIHELELMLANASSLSFDEVVEQATALGALVIPAHIDRPTHSVLTNLGFLPDLPYSAVEMVRPSPQKWSVVTASDAHFLSDVGTRSCTIMLEELSWQALKEGLANQNKILF